MIGHRATPGMGLERARNPEVTGANPVGWPVAHSTLGDPGRGTSAGHQGPSAVIWIVPYVCLRRRRARAYTEPDLRQRGGRALASQAGSVPRSAGREGACVLWLVAPAYCANGRSAVALRQRAGCPGFERHPRLEGIRLVCCPARLANAGLGNAFLAMPLLGGLAWSSTRIGMSEASRTALRT
jgi:hypothetical protein